MSEAYRKMRERLNRARLEREERELAELQSRELNVRLCGTFFNSGISPGIGNGTSQDDFELQPGSYYIVTLRSSFYQTCCQAAYEPTKQYGPIPAVSYHESPVSPKYKEVRYSVLEIDGHPPEAVIAAAYAKSLLRKGDPCFHAPDERANFDTYTLVPFALGSGFTCRPRSTSKNSGSDIQRFGFHLPTGMQYINYLGDRDQLKFLVDMELATLAPLASIPPSPQASKPTALTPLE